MLLRTYLVSSPDKNFLALLMYGIYGIRSRGFFLEPYIVAVKCSCFTERSEGKKARMHFRVVRLDVVYQPVIQ